MSGAINRRFERMFPGIADSERRYNQTLLAEGRGQAELQRKNIEQQTRNDIEGTLLETVVYEFENKTEEFIRSNDLGK